MLPVNTSTRGLATVRSWGITLLDDKHPFGGVSPRSITVISKLALIEIEKPNIFNVNSKASFRTSSGSSPANDHSLRIHWDHLADYMGGRTLDFIPPQARWSALPTSSTHPWSLGSLESVEGLLPMTAEDQETTNLNGILGLLSRFRHASKLSTKRDGVEVLIPTLRSATMKITTCSQKLVRKSNCVGLNTKPLKLLSSSHSLGIIPIS